MSDLNRAVAEFLAEAHKKFTVKIDKESIKESTRILSAFLGEWQLYDRQVHQVLGGMLRVVRSSCSHEGAKSGYNERDGNWMSPCPTCGKSE